MPPAELLRGAVERTVLAGHEGKSGAGLERVRLADATPLAEALAAGPGPDGTRE